MFGPHFCVEQSTAYERLNNVQKLQEKTMEPIMLLIRKQYKFLRPAERKVADFILDEDYDIQKLTIDVLAEKVGVSQPTIVRFARALGLKGFKELKWKVSECNTHEHKKQFTKKVTLPVSKEDKLLDIPTKVITTNIKLLEDTLKNVSSFEFMKAVEAIGSAPRIAVFAVENSGSVAHDLQIKLSYIGLNLVYHTDVYMQKILAANLTSDDVAIGISYSGTSMQTVDSLKIAKKKGATTISITNYEDSAINRYADIILCSGVAQYLSGQDIFSRCVQTAMMDMIYLGILLTDFDGFTEKLEQNGKVISDFSY